jgi:hypothetical protein
MSPCSIAGFARRQQQGGEESEDRLHDFRLIWQSMNYLPQLRSWYPPFPLTLSGASETPLGSCLCDDGKNG